MIIFFRNTTVGLRFYESAYLKILMLIAGIIFMSIFNNAKASSPFANEDQFQFGKEIIKSISKDGQQINFTSFCSETSYQIVNRERSKVLMCRGKVIGVFKSKHKYHFELVNNRLTVYVLHRKKGNVLHDYQYSWQHENGKTKLVMSEADPLKMSYSLFN